MGSKTLREVARSKVRRKPKVKGFWTTAWATSMQGPYPTGNSTGQPEMRFVFPSPERGACDQSFRMIVRPDVWGKQARIRFSNVLGTQPLTVTNVHVGLQAMGSAVLVCTTRSVKFKTRRKAVIAPGEFLWSDPIILDFIKSPDDPLLTGRKLAVSFHVVGESGPMTWHAKALQHSYLAAPSSPSRAAYENEHGFPFPTTAWYFIDALDMLTEQHTRVIVCFGDSITDGTGSTISGDDRWPDVLSRRLHAKYGARISVVNQGIGGNRILGPTNYLPTNATVGGPSALSRLDRDVLGLSGVATIIWLEGINDFGNADSSLEDLCDGVRQGVTRLRAGIPGVRVIMGSMTPTLGGSPATHGRPEVDFKRKQFNIFLETSSLFDGVINFELPTKDEKTGGLNPEMIPSSSIGGPGDGLHPNRIGYQAIGHAISIDLIFGPRRDPRPSPNQLRSAP
jgi:lysophospholipase L1-like esterase